MFAGFATPPRRIQINAASAENVIALFDRRRVHSHRHSVDDTFHAFGAALRAVGRHLSLDTAENFVAANYHWRFEL
jgi:hypothetical protein